jgi:Zn-dependent protease
MPYTSHPLTRPAQTALNQAKRIAQQNGQPAIDSLALLLALLQLPNSQALAILKSLKVKVENLVARISATIKLEAAQPGPAAEEKRSNLDLSIENESVLDESLVEMNDQALPAIDGHTLLLGMLRSPKSKAGQILAQYGVTVEQVRESVQIMKETPMAASGPSFALPNTLGKALRHGVSPIFISLVLFTLAMAGFLWFEIGNNAQMFMFAFVIGGWLISLCLHEFGHAVTAFWGGDESVEDKGYLTLNPLKYTHPIISVVIPVLILLMGGFGFPGGAVYINIYALRKPWYRSLVSAAGPLANMVCLLLLALPFTKLPFYYIFSRAPEELLAAIGLLALLQMTALFINLLPIPGLDGFGILEPFLPAEVLNSAGFLRPFGFILIFLMLSGDTPISNFFWRNVWSAMDLVGFRLAYFANEGVKIFFPG